MPAKYRRNQSHRVGCSKFVSKFAAFVQFLPLQGRIFKPHDDLNYTPPTGAMEKQ